MNNLEIIEQRTLRHLMQVSSPFLAVDDLLRHLQLDRLLEAVSLPELIDFLRHHDLFRVVDMPHFDGDGLVTRPMVVLETRMPSDRDMLLHLYGEMERMEAALQTALREARAGANLARMRDVAALLERLEGIREKLKAQF